MTRTNFGTLTASEIEEIATETGIEIVQVAEAAIDLNSEWNWDAYDDVNIFVEVLFQTLEDNKPSFGPWDNEYAYQMIEFRNAQRWERYGEDWIIAFEAERTEIKE